MSSDERAIPRTTEDLYLKPVGAGPARYARATSGPVRYGPVCTADTVLGYLWVSDRDDAAGFEPRTAAGDEGGNAGVYWYQRLRAAKARDLRPSEALAILAAEAGGTRTGHIVGGSITEIASLDELRARARHSANGP